MAKAEETEGPRLLSWFDARARDLPWRRSRDPYSIWVSEIMLQQTRVGVVVPYFHEFIEKFPDVQALAAGDLGEVMSLWSGLGYYRRARQLHAAAVEVVRSGGEIPRSSQDLRALPGIGEYTAAAIASIAFGEQIPVVDGNVVRVMSRYLALEEEPHRVVGRRAIKKAAAALLDPLRPGDSNQALMELGATLCTPRSPVCEECPLKSGCLATKRGEAESFPLSRPRRAKEKQVRHVVVAETEGTTLFFRRSADSAVLAGTWELPWVPASEGSTVTLAGVEEALAGKYGGSWSVSSQEATVRHSITFRALELWAHRGRVDGGSLVREGVEARFFRSEDLAKQPLSSQVGKVLKAIEKLKIGARES